MSSTANNVSAPLQQQFLQPNDQQQQQQSNFISAIQGQMMNAASNMGVQQQQQQQSNVAPASMPSGGLDMASVLAKIQALEKEKMDMKAQLEQTSGRLTKLQEGKRAEMEAMMNSTISKWLEQLETKDQAAKDALRNGLNKLVNDGNESGVWEVVACASSNWVANVNTIEQLRSEVNQYKDKEKMLQGGLFQNEASRVDYSSGDKRKADGISESFHGSSGGNTSGAPFGLWDEFETMIVKQGGNRGGDYSASEPLGATQRVSVPGIN